jgi:hypothetical protein
MRLRMFLTVACTILAAAAAVGAAQAREAAPAATCAGPASVVQEWVAAWKAKRFRRMAELSEAGWRRTESNPVGTLRNDYGFKDVLSYRFVRCPFATTVSARVTFRVKYRGFGLRRVQITAVVLREDARGDLSAFGDWGVNPISTLRETPIG